MTAREKLAIGIIADTANLQEQNLTMDFKNSMRLHNAVGGTCILCSPEVAVYPCFVYFYSPLPILSQPEKVKLFVVTRIHPNTISLYTFDLADANIE